MEEASPDRQSFLMLSLLNREITSSEEPHVKIKRRDFFKLTAAASTALLPGTVMAGAHAESPDFDKAYGVLVDTTVCIGCRKCEWGCNQVNKLPAHDIKYFDDKSVLKTHRRPTDSAYTVVNSYNDPTAPEGQRYIKVQCMHCNDPACASACIVGAFRKTKEGPVTYDAWKCMGCRYCMVACPFQIPAYEYGNALDPRVVKCTFCFDRVTKEGKKPGCVEICPNEALTFGTRDELINLARGRMRQNPGRYDEHIYGQHEVGGTSWMYLAGIDFINTELPKLTEQPIPESTEKIQHGVFKAFAPPLALYGLLALAMHSLKKDNGKDGGHE
jgi:Fe-S-cluster-containing dehydrogenase component